MPGASTFRVAGPPVHIGLRAASVGAGLVVQVASRLGAFLRYLMLVDHEVVLRVLSLSTGLLAVVLLAECAVVPFRNWSRCVHHSHGSRRKGLGCAIENVVMVLLTWKRLRIVKGLLAMVRIRSLSLCSFWAESLMRHLAVTCASAVEMDGRREGLHVGVLDVATMMEEGAATTCLVGRAAHWSWSSSSMSVHGVGLRSHSEGQVASVILRVVLRIAIHKDRGAVRGEVASAVAGEDTAEWVTRRVNGHLEPVVVHLLLDIGLAQADRSGTEGRVAHWGSTYALRGAVQL